MVRVSGSATAGGRSSILFGDDSPVQNRPPSALSVDQLDHDSHLPLASANARLRYPPTAQFDPERPLTPTTPSRPGSRASGHTPGGNSSIHFGDDTGTYSTTMRRASLLSTKTHSDNPLLSPLPIQSLPPSPRMGHAVVDQSGVPRMPLPHRLSLQTLPRAMQSHAESEHVHAEPSLEQLVRDLHRKMDTQTALLDRLFDIVTRIDAETGSNADEIAMLRQRFDRM
ncbi:hypothetical protein BJ741DRAFT_583384 [Chytriomyces cf. hyalinus JEL632]|nr:hypothetical protein BJ741DRAFT_583384 [Chytriomyces cf. hyalinus JEL632]